MLRRATFPERIAICQYQVAGFGNAWVLGELEIRIEGDEVVRVVFALTPVDASASP